MTLLTSTLRGTLHELSAMVVGVTICARGEFQAAFGLTVPVTLGARHRQMHPFERIARLTVIERCGIHLEPTVGVMAGCTVLAEPAFMSIGMTVGAIGELEAGYFHIIAIVAHRSIHLQRMALDTVYGQMCSRKYKIGFGMIEADSRLPCCLIMAFKTIITELPAMLVQVAALTTGSKTHVRTGRVEMLVRSRRHAAHKLCLMALTALKRRMLSVEHETGQFMIESLLTFLPVDQRNIAAQMFHVTFLTGLIIRSCVQSHTFFLFVLNARMAGQTFFRRQFTIAAVALGAISDSLQKSMRLAQLPRRKLGIRPCRGEQQESKHNKMSPYHTQPYPVQTATPMCTSMIRYMMIANGL